MSQVVERFTQVHRADPAVFKAADSLAISVYVIQDGTREHVVLFLEPDTARRVAGDMVRVVAESWPVVAA